MPNVIRICKQCGQEYKTHHTVRLNYCSSKCAGLAKKRGVIVKCARCGNDFYQQKSKSSQIYCSISCAISARNLTDLNPSYHRDITGSNNPMYGKGRAGQNNPMFGKTKERSPRWTGGKRTRKDGYIVVVAPDDHPYPMYTKNSGTKYILEHRLIIERHLGRHLLPEEVVHHKDGNPSNNDISNLELLPNQSTHARIPKVA